MSGPIQDLPLRACPRCRTIFMEDGHMYLEPEKCPRCGFDPEAGSIREDTNDDGTYVGENYG